MAFIVIEQGACKIDALEKNKYLYLIMDATTEEAPISPDAAYAGMSLVESNMRRDFGITMIAIKKADGRMVFNPLPLEILEGGDVAVVIGKREEQERLRRKLE